MLPAISPQTTTPHETVEAFSAIGFPLHRQLESMLNEDPEHQRPRRGCGFTQASRLLADLVNQPRGLTQDLDLRIFSDVGQRRLNKMIAISRAALGRIPVGIIELRQTLESSKDSSSHLSKDVAQLRELENLSEKLEHEESKLIVELILSVLGKKPSFVDAPTLPLHEDKLAIGTCPEAERYFLEFSGGYVRRHGLINVLVNEQEQPVAVEKINIGDSHSCVTLRTVLFNNVLIPAGSLLGASYSCVPINTRRCAGVNGAWMPISVCEGFRFLRLTTLSVSPENRRRAFKNHLARQLEGSPFFDPLNTRLSDLELIASEQNPGT